jgi:quinoprotein glucose dehydrogenase
MLAGTADETADSLIAFALPEGPPIVEHEVMQSLRPALPNRLSAAELKADGAALPEDTGKDVVVRMCTKCHGTAVFTRMRMGRTGWEDEVASMVERGAVGSEQQVRAVVDYLVRNFGK